MRPEIMKFLEELINRSNWVLAAEDLNKLHDSQAKRVLVPALLDMTSYHNSHLLVKAFEVIHRLFNSDSSLFSEASRV